MLIDAVIKRLEEQVPQLAGRVEGAAQLADLLARRALPPVTPAAHVVPLGFQGRAPIASAGAFIQPLTEVIGVLITIRGNDRTGERALRDLRPFLQSVIVALAGWAPDDQIDVFQFLRGSIVSMREGTAVYQLDFSIMDEVRIFQ